MLNGLWLMLLVTAVGCDGGKMPSRSQGDKEKDEAKAEADNADDDGDADTDGGAADDAATDDATADDAGSTDDAPDEEPTDDATPDEEEPAVDANLTDFTTVANLDDFDNNGAVFQLRDGGVQLKIAGSMSHMRLNPEQSLKPLGGGSVPYWASWLLKKSETAFLNGTVTAGYDLTGLSGAVVHMTARQSGSKAVIGYYAAAGKKVGLARKSGNVITIDKEVATDKCASPGVLTLEVSDGGYKVLCGGAEAIAHNTDLSAFPAGQVGIMASQYLSGGYKTGYLKVLNLTFEKK